MKVHLQAFAVALLAVPAPVAAQMGETIVVTGRGLRPAEEAGAAAVTIDPERIEQSGSGRLEDVLRDVAGVQSFRRSDSRSSHATNQSITLRGLGGNASGRVLLLLDGVPQADPFGGWISFPAYSTDRLGNVRITRGGGSGYFGPGALAGTVELESATPDQLPPVSGALSYGSRGSLDVRGTLLAGNDARFVVASAAFARGKGFIPIVEDDRGPVDRPAPYRQWSAALRAVQRFREGTEAQFNLSAFRDERDRGVPFTGNRGKGVDTSIRLVGSGRTRWSVLGYGQFRDFSSEFSSVDEARTVSTETLDQYSVPSRGLGARAELNPLRGSLDIRIGADVRAVKGEARELYQFVAGEPTRRREAGGRSITAGVFGAARWTRNQLQLSASGRIDRWSISGGRLKQETVTAVPLTDLHFADRSGTKLTGRVAGEWRASASLKLRAAAYRGWRLPTPNELYRPFRVGPDATAPNPELAPESMTGAEVGADLSLSRALRFGVTGYLARLEEAIANVTVARGPGVFPVVGFVSAAGSFRRRENLDAIRSRGVELDLSAQRGRFRGLLSYAFVDARVIASGLAAPLSGKRPAQTPKHHLSATAGWTGANGLDLSATGRAVSAQFDDDLGTRKLRGAFTVDAYASVPLKGGLAVELRGENLLDRRVEAARSGTDVVERALPRTIWIGLRLR